MPGADRASSGRMSGQPKILFKDQKPREEAPPPHSSGKTARVLFSGGVAEPRVAEPIAEQQPQPAVPFGAPRRPPPKDQRPKVIAGGLVRRRVPCSHGALQQMDASATQPVIAEAQRIIDITNLDDAYFDDALRFGAELQGEHAAIAEAELTLANAEPFRQGQLTLTRMLQLLGTLDPQRLFSQRRANVADRLKALLDPAPPADEIFAVEYPKLVASAQEMQALEPRLIALSGQAQELGSRYTALQEGIASHLLAANYLIRFIREHPEHGGNQAHYASQADVLETRLSSLLATQATIEMGRMNNEILQQNIQTLIAAGRGMLEEDLPAFSTSYTAALNTAGQSSTAADNSSIYQSARDVHARLTRKMRGER